MKDLAFPQNRLSKSDRIGPLEAACSSAGKVDCVRYENLCEATAPARRILFRTAATPFSKEATPKNQKGSVRGHCPLPKGNVYEHRIGSKALAQKGAFRLPSMMPLDHVRIELEGAIASGSAARCAVISKGITDLFAQQSRHLSDAEVEVFDELLTRLTIEIEVAARAIMAVRLAPIPNAPPKAIRKLAFDDAIEVAAPVLAQSERLTDEDLAENARHKSQDHLLAIAGRPVLNESVTDVLVKRGNRQVLLSTVGNKGAKLSGTGFSIVVQRSEDDGELAVCVGSRAEIPQHLFRQLVAKASQTVRATLTAAHPEACEDIRNVVAEVAENVAIEAAEHSHWPALSQPSVRDESATDIDNRLAVNDLGGVASAIATLSNMPIEFVDRAIGQRSVETFLVLARAANLSVSALRRILQVCGKGHMAINDIEKSLVAYRRLKIETAEEILRFYRMQAKPRRLW